MKILCCGVAIFVAAWFANPSTSPSRWPEEEATVKRCLQVIRLKPEERQFIELALPYGQFRSAAKSGRSDLHVSLYPGKEGDPFVQVAPESPDQEKHFKAAPHAIAEGVSLRWSEERPGIEIAANATAPAGSKDILVTYTNFGFEGPHTIGLRVIVVPK